MAIGRETKAASAGNDGRSKQQQHLSKIESLKRIAEAGASGIINKAKCLRSEAGSKVKAGYAIVVWDSNKRLQDGKHIFEHVVQDLLAGGHISEDKFVDRALDSMRQVTAQLHANIAMLSKKEGDKWELDFNSKFFLTFNFCF